MWKALGGFATFVLCIVALWVVHDRQPIHRLGSDSHDLHTTLLVWSPHVSPGDTVVAEVYADGGDEIVIYGVEVYGAGASQAIAGDGKTWGSTIRIGLMSASTSLRVPVQIPDDIAPGTELDLIFEVTFESAQGIVIPSERVGRFWNYREVERLHYRVTVQPALRSALGRVASGVLALAILALAYVVIRWLVAKGEAGAGVRHVVLPIAVAYAVIGHLSFVRLALASTELTHLVFRVGWHVIWLAGPLIVMALRDGHGTARFTINRVDPVAGGGAYRDGGQATATTPLSDGALTAALMAAGFLVSGRGRRLSLALFGGGRARVRMPVDWPASAEPIRVRADSASTAVRIAHALARRVGVVRCELGTRSPLVVRGTDRSEDLEREAEPRTDAVCADRGIAP